MSKCDPNGNWLTPALRAAATQARAHRGLTKKRAERNTAPSGTVKDAANRAGIGGFASGGF
jgi:hypothetical protein